VICFLFFVIFFQSTELPVGPSLGGNKWDEILKEALIVVIRNLVFNGKTQLIEGEKQSWPISFY